MQILVKNLQRLPFTYELDADDGSVIRELLQPKDLPGDTVDIGRRVDPWEFNRSFLARSLVVPGSIPGTITPVPGGYRVDDPGGQVSVTFVRETNDVVFFDSSSGSGMPPATAIGQVLLSTDGVAFTPELPLTSANGWMVNDLGRLLVK
jgi:hypothetical protein